MKNLELSKITLNEDMSCHCSIHTGGVAKMFVYARTIQEMAKYIRYCEKSKVQYFILGNGTNTIFTDQGYNGLVICTNKLKDIKVKKIYIICECGVNLFSLNSLCIHNQLSGIEWSYGIPGTIGGAVCMNAGAYNGEFKYVVKKVLILKHGRKKWLKNNKLQFEYRGSIIKKEKLIILKVVLKLKKDKESEIKKRCDEFLNRRRLTQPLEKYNMGSIFKKHNNESAGKIIDNLGLKGVKLGKAEVSTLHANFIVNNCDAKSSDILGLIRLVKDRVYNDTGIVLEEEIIKVGEDK